MLEMVLGCSVPRADLLFEQYDIDGNYITANVNAGKIADVMRHFITMQDEHLFFILEIPTSADEEAKLRKSDASPLHTDVYYIDLLTADQALFLVKQYGDLLINDGMSEFGFGVCGSFSTEIMIHRYNIVSVYSKNLIPYADFFASHNIPQVEQCFTAWQTFSNDAPGQCSRIDRDGISVYDLPEKLKDWGIYFSERRER